MSSGLADWQYFSLDLSSWQNLVVGLLSALCQANLRSKATCFRVSTKSQEKLNLHWVKIFLKGSFVLILTLIFFILVALVVVDAISFGGPLILSKLFESGKISR